MATTIPILARDHWDVPRIFLVKRPDGYVLFDCEFDDETEDYADSYRVYLLPDLSPEALVGSWADFRRLATAELGEVAVADVTFDSTGRNAIDLGLLERMEARARAG